MWVKKQQLEPCIEQLFHDKGVQGCLWSPCLFNLHAEYIMRNARLSYMLKSRLPGKISTTSHLMAENEEVLKNLLRVEESGKASLKH